MIAVDTNVLVRLLVADDAAQAEKARRLLEAQEESGSQVWVSDTVLVELLWTLSRTYGRSREELLMALQALSQNTTVSLESAVPVRRAMELFARTVADFADCLLCTKAASAGCEQVVTFDKGMKSLPGARVL